MGIWKKNEKNSLLHINLLTEHEVTRLIGLVDSIASHLKIENKSSDLKDLKKDTSPEKVFNVIEKETVEKKPIKG